MLGTLIRVTCHRATKQMSDIKPKVLCTVGGSGNYGERTDKAHFYTLAEHPSSLTIGKSANLNEPVRHDIDLGVLAFTIDNILSSEEADALVAVTECMGYSRFAPSITTPPGMRQNQACHWFAPEETVNEFLQPMWQRFQHLLPRSVERGDKLHDGLSHRFAHYKYDGQDVFNRHTDGCWPGQSINATGDGIEQWEGCESKLSMLLYLSDAEGAGGCTRLFHPDGSYYDVSPKKGTALFFRHGHGPDSVLHAGMPLTGDRPKYVLRLNVLYDDANQ